MSQPGRSGQDAVRAGGGRGGGRGNSHNTANTSGNNHGEHGGRGNRGPPRTHSGGRTGSGRKGHHPRSHDASDTSKGNNGPTSSAAAGNAAATQVPAGPVQAPTPAPMSSGISWARVASTPAAPPAAPPAAAPPSLAPAPSPEAIALEPKDKPIVRPPSALAAAAPTIPTPKGTGKPEPVPAPSQAQMQAESAQTQLQFGSFQQAMLAGEQRSSAAQSKGPIRTTSAPPGALSDHPRERAFIPHKIPEASVQSRSQQPTHQPPATPLNSGPPVGLPSGSLQPPPPGTQPLAVPTAIPMPQGHLQAQHAGLGVPGQGPGPGIGMLQQGQFSRPSPLQPQHAPSVITPTIPMPMPMSSASMHIPIPPPGHSMASASPPTHSQMLGVSPQAMMINPQMFGMQPGMGFMQSFGGFSPANFPMGTTGHPMQGCPQPMGGMAGHIRPHAPRSRAPILITNPDTGKAVDLSAPSTELESRKTLTNGGRGNAGRGSAAGRGGGKGEAGARPASNGSQSIGGKDKAAVPTEDMAKEEAAKKFAAEDAKKKAEAESQEKKKAAEEAEAARKVVEEMEAKKKAEEEAEAAKKSAEEAAKQKAEEELEAKRKAEEELEAKRKAEEEAAAAKMAEEDLAKVKAEAAAAARSAAAAGSVANLVGMKYEEKHEEDKDETQLPVSSGLSKKAAKKAAMENFTASDVFSDPAKSVAAAAPKAPLSLEPPKAEVEKPEAVLSPDDWEKAADGLPTPKPAASTQETKRKHPLRYTRDFLMKMQQSFVDMPPGLEFGEYLAECYNSEDHMRGGGTLSRTSSRGMGRAPSGDFARMNIGGPPMAGPPMAGPPMAGPPMGGPPMGRQGSGNFIRTGSWNQMDQRMMGPPVGRGGRGMGRAGSGNFDGFEGDRWGHKSLPPGPPPGVGSRGGRGGPPGMSQHMMSGPVPALHKTDNAYKPGETLSDDPEEEKRQKAYKSHLNKLTPDNFDRLCDKILQVPVEGQKTLVGFINQIFDKALAETTFCELYASLCERVNPSMPKFPDPESEREINFKRVLLNKCQEEFERGDAAMKAIAEKEKADKETGKESGKEDAEKEVGEEGKDKDDEEEEGEIVEDDETKRKREEIKKYKINLLARKRMLGNIQFIGHLYKKKMLTERIMHECIQKLLGDVESPNTEDVECLCKLMSTIGAQIDHEKTKQHMDIYFKRIAQLTHNKSLESRLRFMLQDVIDLRYNGWMERRKVEGPKKIQDIHRDARMESVMQSDRRGDRRGGPGDRGGPGGRGDRRGVPGGRSDLDAYGGPPRGFGGPPPMMRLDDRVDGPIRPMKSLEMMGGGTFRPGGGGGRSIQEPPSPSSVSLRPQGTVKGGPGGMGMRMESQGGGPGGLRGGAPPGADMSRDLPSQGQFRQRDMSPGRANNNRPESDAPARSTAQTADEDDHDDGWSEEMVCAKAKALANEFYGARDMKEAVACIQDLEDRKADMGLVLEVWIRDALESKDRDWELFTKLLDGMTTGDNPHMSASVVEDGLRRVLDVFGDVAMDVPKAPEQVGQLAAKFVLSGLLSLKAFTSHILEAFNAKALDEEEPSTMDMGYALPLVAEVLAEIRESKGSAAAAAEWESVGVELKQLLPSFERDDEQALAKQVEKHGLGFLKPLTSVKTWLEEAMAACKTADDILAWLDGNVDTGVAKSPDFVHMLSEVILRGLLPDAGELPTRDSNEQPWTPGITTMVPLLKKYVKNSTSTQLAAIQAAQEIFHEYNHPKGLMRRFLDDMYSTDLIEEGAIMKWRDSRDDTSAKQKAIIDTSAWLDRLQEDDEGES